MITLTIQSIYYIIGIEAIICGVAYKFGYEAGKNERK